MSSESLWRDGAWRKEAEAWIEVQVSGSGATFVGEIEQPHITPWATILQVPVNDGYVYFKAVAPAFRFEIRLTSYLGHTWPGVTPRVLAEDVDRHWLLMADGGQRLRELLQAKSDLSHWERVLHRYARLQQSSLDQTEHLLAMGTPDRRLRVLIERLDRFLANPARLIGDEFSEGDLMRLTQALPDIKELAEALSAVGIGAGLDHGDFHDGNIFINQGEYVFFDWGDAGVTHPFFSLRTAFVSLENSLGFQEDAPVFERLADCYLGQWSEWGTLDVLRKAYLHSRPLAALNAAVRWQYAIDTLDPGGRSEYREIVPSLLSECLIYLDKL